MITKNGGEQREIQITNRTLAFESRENLMSALACEIFGLNLSVSIAYLCLMRLSLCSYS